ncbi:Glutamate 5-kinase [Roseimaritima multifibrata]|uniref:Glutamate 5-kinase n=1 Tax=Roseimaritima multifibrata TaxID=1930274 RepID=A0A517M918_9BACT|nr:glutamate 5-kinase [Roseimaritima multifibrata]QDS91287.1 Glutamate 5-kinase [Roseimaritima multifibrata]
MPLTPFEPDNAPDPQRVQLITEIQTVIVKVGTRVLTGGSGQLNLERIKQLSEQLCRISNAGYHTVLVSSGAVGAGMGRLGMTTRPTGLAKLQAVAAIGQSLLIQAYEDAMSEMGYHAAQVLLTAEDLRHRTTYLNIRNALLQIHELGSIAVINENDSVAVEELMTTFGDNDRMAAAVSGLLQDALLVMLSDVDGLMDGHPRETTSQVIPEVETMGKSIWNLVLPPDSDGMSKGGMASKLLAASTANSFGHSAIIAAGHTSNILDRIFAGEQIGTLFLPSSEPLMGRRRWIGDAAAIAGQVHIDDGATAAIFDGNSLLSIGIVRCNGGFQRGDCVEICEPSGRVVARGLTNYSSQELEKIAGVPTDRIADVLGHCPYDAAIHRDNMAIGGEEETYAVPMDL